KLYAAPWTDVGVERTATPEYSYSPLLKGNNSLGNTIFSFTNTSSAADPLALGIAPDIDFNSTFSITENKDLGKLFVSATISGENYPATESFVQDAGGTGVFIGAWTASGTIMGDYGTNDNKLINIDLQININDQGHFTGVVHKGTTYSVTDWNKKFEQQSTKE